VSLRMWKIRRHCESWDVEIRVGGESGDVVIRGIVVQICGKFGDLVSLVTW